RPSFPQKRESSNTTQQEFIGKTETPTDRHSRKAGIQQPKNHRNLSAKTETPTAVIPAKAGIQTRRHGNLPNKTVSLDSTS
ncbi:hypothetical protein, partial [Neisseria meningitidis]|uniref:hypothetical protein n=1 Tax=Neisseria meningitidis TaxID=487 RepID=UPI001E3E42C5